MNSNETWFAVFVNLGVGFVFLAFLGILLAVTNPKIDAKCAERGGQILHTPGHFNSCIYPTK